MTNTRLRFTWNHAEGETTSVADRERANGVLLYGRPPDGVGEYILQCDGSLTWIADYVPTDKAYTKSYDLVEDAGRLWEAVLEHLQRSPAQATETTEILWRIQKQGGMADMRSRVIDLAPTLQKDYLAAVADGYDAAFDWEFVPDWLAEHVIAKESL